MQVDECYEPAQTELRTVFGLQLCSVQVDERYEPAQTELRTVFGLQLEQRRNDAVVDNKLFTNIVTTRQHVRFICIYVFSPYFSVHALQCFDTVGWATGRTSCL